jgi:hypothetical protein
MCTYQVDFHQTNIIYFVMLFSLLVNTVAVFISPLPSSSSLACSSPSLSSSSLPPDVSRYLYCAHRLRRREKLVWSIVTTSKYLMCTVELHSLTTTFAMPLVAHQQPLLLAAPSSSPPTLSSTHQHCLISNAWGGYLRGQSNCW